MWFPAHPAMGCRHGGLWALEQEEDEGTWEEGTGAPHRTSRTMEDLEEEWTQRTSCRQSSKGGLHARQAERTAVVQHGHLLGYCDRGEAGEGEMGESGEDSFSSVPVGRR